MSKNMPVNCDNAGSQQRKGAWSNNPGTILLHVLMQSAPSLTSFVHICRNCLKCSELKIIGRLESVKNINVHLLEVTL